MNILNTLLLSEGKNAITSLVPLILIIAVFYFLMIRPQAKRMKTQKKFLEGLSENDKVVTIGGLYGVIKSISTSHVDLEISKGVVVKVQRGAISPEASQALKQSESSK